mgnify:CR=1|tara:strand:- start:904 stop:1125 length:222 start_codon:yes stop_codon:yes gene_type:complete
MEDLIKEIFKMVVQIKKISEANNDLLGFVCSKVAPTKKITTKEIDLLDVAYISMEMSEIFEEYDVMPEDYGIA